MPGWDEHPHAGHSNGDPFEMPADLAAVQADDALLDMIAAGHAPSDAGDELTRVLAAWRHEVHAEPVKELVDTSTALAVIRAAARQPARRRSPVFGSIAGAAAVVVIAFSSVGLVAKSAEPGDPLWRVTEVLYSEYAESVETAAAIETELNEANRALKQGNQKRAREALQHVQQKLPAVGESEGRTQLTTRHQELAQQLPPESVIRAQDITPPKPSGTGPEAGKPDQPTMPSHKGTTTYPDTSGGGTNTSPTDPDQFLPDPGTYDPTPGGAGGRNPSERGAQDFQSPGEQDLPEAPPGYPRDQTPGNAGDDDTSPPPPSPLPEPAPGPPPDSDPPVGAEAGTGPASAPPPHSSDFPFMSGASSDGPM